MQLTKSYLKDLVYRVNGAAIAVHKAFGPGLLEKIYHVCLVRELTARGIKHHSEVTIPVIYRGDDVPIQLRCDLIIEDVLPVELKAVEQVHPVHAAQLMTYMKLLNAPQGLLINFNVVNIFKDGQRTYVNEWYRDLPD